MQDGFWSVFSETGDVVGYLLCCAAEYASRADGGPAPVGGGKAQVHAAHALRTREAVSASPTAGITSASGGASGENGGDSVSV